ncbi:protein FAM111A [Larimichthys crocea]|uniref:protein FAM111A n=1 Tax=Larimichthys crocea TaxID=215358 RepID=UPI000F5E6D3E|nr:protein FAM111A [Larimichthys crocea]
MPSRKSQSQSKDIRSFFKKSDNPQSNGSSTPTESTQPGGATSFQPGGATDCQLGEAMNYEAAAQTRVKRENDCDSMDGHSHQFRVKFSRTDCEEYTVTCDKPCTVLKAIKSLEIYKKKMKCSDVKIVIQLGEGDRKSIVATHFPCSLIEHDKCLIISEESEQVEVAQDQYYETTYSSEKYSVFYIDTVGGKYTRTKQLFRNNALKQFKYLCVYGEKGETVEEALKRDGRFIDNLGNFTLSDNDEQNRITECTQKVDNLNGKQFKICLTRGEKADDEEQQENPGTSSNPQQKSATRPVLDVAKQSGVSVRKVIKMKESGSSVDTQEIYEILRKQFPALRELMQSRFPGDSYQTALELRKEDFGKIQQSFSEVHRVRKLLKLGESVCKVVVPDVCQGTGFVLFDNFILTNGHLFKDRVDGDRLMEGTEVCVLFNYDDPEPFSNSYYFNVDNSYICLNKDELDYAVLELNPQVQKLRQTTQTEKLKVPPGLLKNFGPVPENGEACIIGHPAGGVKKMDFTCIIEKEKRGQAVSDHLDKYKETIFTIHSIENLIKNQNIESIMIDGTRAENIATYDTFMYHGSSGSPVFDAQGQVFGLHTAGYTYGFPNHTESVIEFAQSVLTIFEHFVGHLKERGDEELLRRVEEEAQRNPYLKKILNSFCEEDMDVDFGVM